MIPNKTRIQTRGSSSIYVDVIVEWSSRKERSTDNHGWTGIPRWWSWRGSEPGFGDIGLPVPRVAHVHLDHEVICPVHSQYLSLRGCLILTRSNYDISYRYAAIIFEYIRFRSSVDVQEVVFDSR